MTDTAQAEPPTGVPAVIRLNANPLDWPRLPKAVKAKLRDLRRARDDGRLAWRAVSDERAEAWDDKRSVEARLTVLTGGRPNSPWYGHAQHANYYRLEDDHPDVAEQLTKLADAKANIERLDRLVEVRAHRMDQLSRLLSSIDDLPWRRPWRLLPMQSNSIRGRRHHLRSARPPRTQSSVAAAAFVNLTPTVTGSHRPHGLPQKPSGGRVRKSTRWLRAGNRTSAANREPRRVDLLGGAAVQRRGYRRPIG